MNQISKANSVQPEQLERVALFIDGANLYAASRTLGFDVDYKNLLAYFRQRSYLVRAYYYTALLETEEYSPLRPLGDWLGYKGYPVGAGGRLPRLGGGQRGGGVVPRPPRPPPGDGQRRYRNALFDLSCPRLSW